LPSGRGRCFLPGAQQLAPIAALALPFARHPSVAALLSALWVAGALLMLLRLLVRISRERRTNGGQRLRDAPAFRVQGVPVHFTAGCQGPAVEGMLRGRICLPPGIQHLLSERCTQCSCTRSGMPSGATTCRG
jgi:beta-lactamase regulating signal transducer with metallopeptidase domain